MSDETTEEKPPEVTLEALAAKVEVVANTVGLMFLALGGYPISQDLVSEMVERCGVGHDKSQLGGRTRIVQASAIPPPLKRS